MVWNNLDYQILKAKFATDSSSQQAHYDNPLHAMARWTDYFIQRQGYSQREAVKEAIKIVSSQRGIGNINISSNLGSI
jgi:hypothetical protein